MDRLQVWFHPSHFCIRRVEHIFAVVLERQPFIWKSPLDTPHGFAQSQPSVKPLLNLEQPEPGKSFMIEAGYAVMSGEPLQARAHTREGSFKVVRAEINGCDGQVIAMMKFVFG